MPKTKKAIYFLTGRADPKNKKVLPLQTMGFPPNKTKKTLFLARCRRKLKNQ